MPSPSWDVSGHVCSSVHLTGEARNQRAREALVKVAEIYAKDMEKIV